MCKSKFSLLSIVTPSSFTFGSVLMTLSPIFTTKFELSALFLLQLWNETFQG